MFPGLAHLRGTAGGAFAPLVLALGWIPRAARLLGQTDRGGAAGRNPMAGLLGATRRHRESVGELGGGRWTTS